MELTSGNVQDIMAECLSDSKDARTIVGIVHTYGINMVKLEARKEDIRSMLNQLPDEFHATKGGGWSFLNACVRKDGSQWTGLHLVMEALFVLSIAADLAEEIKIVPREYLPGGMPYYMVKT